MRCPLCGTRKARRACPAQGVQICSVCCGSKRLIEIACPADCAYLASSREHPPAIEVRRYEQDMARMAPVVHDFTRLQGELFLLFASTILQDSPDGLQKLLDEDVAAAAGALASTLETAARGVIYEHRPATRPAERLLGVFRTVLQDAGRQSSVGSRLEREAVLVLRRLEEAARGNRPAVHGNGRDFIELLGRVVRIPEGAPAAPTESPSRLIVP